jgi:2-(1,2-epoxy-1,2-dihydrophenyl)acetyl-CoA isomerase
VIRCHPIIEEKATMSYHTLKFEHDAGIGTIRLDRPQDGNALTLEMARELLDVAIRCDEDPAIRVVVLTGNGKMFCAGGDLKAFAAQGDHVSRHLKEITSALHGAISRFNWMDAPTIAAVNGTAAGAGFSLALMADVAVAAASARFVMAYTNAGLAPDGSSSFFLAKAVGMRRAKELALLNPVLSAQQALEWGVVNAVVADDQVLVRAMDWARQFAAGPTRAYGETKRLMLSGATESLDSQMARESRAIAAMAASPSGREGVAAFLAKRPPRFQCDEA